VEYIFYILPIKVDQTLHLPKSLSAKGLNNSYTSIASIIENLGNV